jgi:hypothetical protein
MEIKVQSQTVTPNATDKRVPYRTPKLKRYGKVATMTSGGAVEQSTEDPTFTPLLQTLT